jgi:hypothetical protein
MTDDARAFDALRNATQSISAADDPYSFRQAVHDAGLAFALPQSSDAEDIAGFLAALGPALDRLFGPFGDDDDNEIRDDRVRTAGSGPPDNAPVEAKEGTAS